MKRFLCLLSVVILVTPGIVRPRPLTADTSKPNIVILLADDLGYGDVGYHGSDIRTPNIDGLAEQGVRLERFYSCPVCSPTRAGLMTGRWPIRYGLMRTVIPPWSAYGLPTDEQTLADMLAEAGYERRAVIGKWHLGHSATTYLPLARGFTFFYGHYNGAIDYFTHEREGEIDWHRGDETAHEEGYSTDLLAREAVRFIDESPADKPFFLYVPFNAPHSPYQAKPDDIERYPQRENRRQIYAAMVDSLDQGIGQILAALDRRGFAQRTFVLFFSDNGGVRGVGDNGTLRGAKSTVYEGGVRVPAIVRWPAGDLAGGRIVRHPMGYIDIHPTLRRIAGAATPPPKPYDGRDVLDVMRGSTTPSSRPWFSFIAMGEPEQIALTTDSWKLVVSGPSVLEPMPTRAAEIELFLVADEIDEQTNLADQHPEIVARLMEELKQFRALKIEGVQPYNAGRDGFRAPKDWIIRD